jgi:TrmH family RNA methyltransferase
MITSKNNPQIREIRLLKQAKHRRARSQYLIEGVRLFEEALQQEKGIRTILYSPRLEGSDRGVRVLSSARKKNFQAEWIHVSDEVLGSLGDTQHHQGILAVLDQRNWNWEDLGKRGGVILLLCALQDPGNLGTLFRLAEAAGSAGLILGQGCVDPFNSKAVRASMGSLFRIPFLVDQDLGRCLHVLRGQGYTIWASGVPGRVSFWDVDFSHPCAVLLGQEGAGIPPDLLPADNHILSIPMAAPVDSLNVAMAGGIILYEAWRQKRKAASAAASQ